MNIALIFAGGTGQRMNSSTRPKQFLELHGKPILIYTLEQFETHEFIDAIVVVCVESWIDYCKGLIEKFGIKKVSCVMAGGKTGFLSRYLGISQAYEMFPPDSLVLFHDGVRPLIDHDTITRNIQCAKKYKSAVTVSPSTETVALQEEKNKVGRIIDRSQCQLAKAPQTFILKDVYQAHKEAVEKGIEDCIDTAYLMQKTGHSIHTVQGKPENIKITTPADFYIFRALLDAKENTQIFG